MFTEWKGSGTLRKVANKQDHNHSCLNIQQPAMVSVRNALSTMSWGLGFFFFFLRECVHVYVCMCVFVCTCAYVCMCNCIGVYVRASVRVRARLCVGVGVFYAGRELTECVLHNATTPFQRGSFWVLSAGQMCYRRQIKTRADFRSALGSPVFLH